MMDDAEIQKMAAAMASQAADDVEAFWINPLNDFLLAGTPQEAVRALARHPQLMTATATGLIDKFMADARMKSKPAETPHLEERRRLIEVCKTSSDPTD
jgi:hypothetical protein